MKGYTLQDESAMVIYIFSKGLWFFLFSLSESAHLAFKNICLHFAEFTGFHRHWYAQDRASVDFFFLKQYTKEKKPTEKFAS